MALAPPAALGASTCGAPPAGAARLSLALRGPCWSVAQAGTPTEPALVPQSPLPPDIKRIEFGPRPARKHHWKHKPSTRPRSPGQQKQAWREGFSEGLEVLSLGPVGGPLLHGVCRVRTPGRCVDVRTRHREGGGRQGQGRGRPFPPKVTAEARSTLWVRAGERCCSGESCGRRRHGGFRELKSLGYYFRQQHANLRLCQNKNSNLRKWLVLAEGKNAERREAKKINK